MWILPIPERLESPNRNISRGPFKDPDVFIVHAAIDGDLSPDEEEIDQFDERFGLSFAERDRSHDCMDVARLFGSPRRGASTHFVVGRDGSKVQCVSLDDTAWGAGGGAFPISGTGPLERPRGREMNRRAVQAELCNAGFCVDELRIPEEDRTEPIPHPGNLYKDLVWETFPTRQIETLLYLVALTKQVRPSIEFITGHEDVVNSHTISAKYGWPKKENGRRFGGKVDPGPAFPWWSFGRECRAMGIVPVRYDFKQRAWVERE